MKNPVNARVGDAKHSSLVILCGLLILGALWDATGFSSMPRVPAPNNNPKFDRGAYATKAKSNAIRNVNIAAGGLPMFTGESTTSGSKLNWLQFAINNSVIVQPGRANRRWWDMTAEKLEAGDLAFLAGTTIQQGSVITSASQAQFANGSVGMLGGGRVIAPARGPALAPAASGVNRFWGNNSGGDWNSKANWVPIDPDPAGPDTDPPSVPAAGDSATFGVDVRANDGDSDDDQGNSIGTYTVTVNGNTIDSVGIGTATITFDLAGSFTVTNGFGLANQTSDVTISGTGAMSSGTITLGGGKFTISQASVSTGDFIGTSGGTLLIHNGGTLTSGANTTMSVGIIATVDGANSMWTNTGLLTANSLNITNGAMVKTDSANIGFGGLNLTGGSFDGGALSASLVNATANSQLSDTSVLLNAAADSTLDASTWNITGKFTGGSGSFLTVKNGANMASDSAELLLSAGVKVDGSGTVWNNTNDLTIQQSAGTNAGLDIENGGHVTVGGNLIAFGSASLNNAGTGASGLLVMGRVDVARGGSANVGPNATLTSGGGVTSRSGLDTNTGFVLGSSITVSGTWTNTGDFVVGESGSGGPFAENDLTVNAGGKVTTTGDFFVGQTSTAPNFFNLNSGGTVTDVNGVLAQGAGVTTNAFVDGMWTNSGKLTIADAGTARMTIGFSTANGVVSSLDATVGNQAGSNGSVGVRNGSMWKVNGNLILGAGGTGSAFVERGSTLMVTGDSVTLGRDSGSNGTLSLDNAASRFDFGGQLTIGLNGTGTLNVESGFHLDNSAQDLVLGKAAGSFGTLNVRNADTTAAFRNATIGSLGAGTVLVEDTGLLHNIGNAILGEMAGGNGAATITGIGTMWKIDGNLVVGLAGDTLGGKGIGHVVVMNGAELVVNGQFLTLGQEFGSQGTLTLDGVGSKASGLAALQIGRHGDGTLEVINGASAVLSSTILGIQSDGSGTIRVAGKGPNGGPASMVTTQGSLTVGGASPGTLLVTNGGQMITDQGAAIIGRDANVTGIATLSGQDSQWTINGPGSTVFSAVPGNLTVAQAGIGSFTVSDHANFTAGSIIVGQNAKSNGTVTLTGSGGTNDSMMMANSLTVGDGGIGLLSVSNGAKLDVGVTIIGSQANSFGTLKVTGTSPTDTATSVTVTELTVGFIGHGELAVLNGATFTDTGSLFRIDGSNNSSITVDGLGSFLYAFRADVEVGSTNQANLTISNQGFLRTAGGFIRNGSVVNVNGANSEWQIGSDGLDVGASGNGFLIIDAGRVIANGPVTLGDSDFGQVLVDNSGSLTINGGNSIVIGNGARAEVSMSSGSQISAASAVIGNNSSLNLLNAGAQFTVNGLTVGRSAGDTGTVTVDNGHVSANLLSVTKGSTVSVTGGSIDLGATLGQAPAGQIQVGFGGKLKDNGVVTGNVTTQLGGSVGGSGTINGKLINGGKVAPGDPQTLTVNGDYEQQNGGLLQIAITGETLAEFDHLNVTGHVTLDMGANLELDFMNGFAPKTGDKFDFLQSGDPLITGTFSNVTITGLAPGFQFVVGPDGVGTFGLIALNDGVAASVPEPGAVFLILFSALLTTVASRRAAARKS